jgi:UDP-N-acetylmuramoyl-tripeptide--D-alanyl-D-alanine ligase
MEYDLIIEDKKTHIKTAHQSKQFFSNDLAAAAIAHAAGIDIEDIKKGLESSTIVQGRMERIETGDITIINDTYNANPVSMDAALNSLSKMSGYTHKLAVLGDMLELGTDSEQFHKTAGEKAAKTNLDYLFLFGSFALDIKKGAVNADMAENKISVFEDIEALNQSVKKHLQKGDVILIKGSRGMQLERVVCSIKDS